MSPSKILRSEQDGFIRGNDSTEAPKFNLWGINYELRSRKRLPKGEITNYTHAPSEFCDTCVSPGLIRCTSHMQHP